MGNLLRLLFLLPLGLTLSACAAVGPGAPSAASSTSSAERPTYKLGDKWIRSDGVFEVVRMENDQYVFVSSSGNEVHLSRDLGLARTKASQYFDEFDPPLKLTWPLEVGKWGVTYGTWRFAANPIGSLATFTWRVDGYEDVTVPAGTFKSFRIQIVVEGGGGLRYPFYMGGARGLLLWYAPEVRQFVKSEATPGFLALGNFTVVALDKSVGKPLAIRLTEPDDGLTSADAETVVAGTVKGGKGVSRVVVTVNGAEAFVQPGTGVADEAVTLNVPVKLKEGKNVILVTGTDPSGESQQEARTVVYEAYEPLTLPPEGQQVRVANDKIRLGGRVSAPTGITWFSVSLNEVERFVGWKEGAPEAAFEVPLKLNEGENLVVVRVSDPRGELTKQTRIIVLDRSPTPATAPPPPAVALSPPPSPPPPPAKPEPPRPVPRRAEPPKAELPKPVPAVTPKPEPPRPPPVVAPPAIVSAPPAVAALPKPEPPPVPFQVRISSPGDQARFEYDAIALAGLVSGGRGVSRVIVTVNGQEVSRVDERRPAVALNLSVKLREGQNTLVVTATDTDGAPYQEVRTVHYEKVVPLTVELRHPEDRAKFTDASTVVVATISSSKGVARVGVTVNGAEVAQPDEIGARDVAVTLRVRRDGVGAGPLQKTVALTVPVTLREGSNVIVVTASEADGTARQAIRTVVYDRPVPLAAAPAAPVPAPPKPAPNRWAVIIGVGSYESPGVSKLRYPVNDAEALYEVLTGPAGFKKEHVLLLTDKTEKKPTLRNIKWALGTFLGRSAKKDDTVLVFFAGHGAPEVDTRGVERDGLAKYLVPADADADDLFSTALPMDDLQAIFGRIEAERVVAFLDACYSGAAGGRTFAAKATRVGNLDEQFLERLTRSKGRAIITASRPSEVSMELDELKHGIFTYFLVRGLKGAADLNRDGIVTLQELYEYVEQQVAQKSRAVGGNQHPIMKGELEGTLPIVKVGK